MTTTIERLRSDVHAAKDGSFPTVTVMLRDLELLLDEFDTNTAAIAGCVVDLDTAGLLGHVGLRQAVRQLIEQLKDAKEPRCDF